MATIDMIAGGTSEHKSRMAASVPYVVERYVDFSDVLEDKGSALAAADYVKVIQVPAEAIVLSAGVEIEEAADSTTLTLDLGYGEDSVTYDVYTDGADAKTEGYGALGTNGKLVANALRTTSAADTLDLRFATLTGTLTTGLVRVYAVLMDIAGKPRPASTKVTV